MLNEFLILIMAYLIGSIPSGLVLSYFMGYGDLRKIGSGNIGATNALRTGNKLLAFLTLFCDAGKIILAIVIAHKLKFHQDHLIGATAVFGHLYPVWLKLKGGKGVASFLGLSIYLYPMISFFMVLGWVSVFLLFRISSFAALSTAIFTLAALILTQKWDFNLLLMIGLIALIIYKHKENIIRLLNGEESSFKSNK